MTAESETAISAIDALLAALSEQIQLVLGIQLVGLYLYGSAVTGDFTPGVSDLDLLAAVQRDIADAELAALNDMHDRFATAHPAWNDRIEVAYLSLRGLQTFRTETTRLAIISPGEPLHYRDADHDWLMNWYLVRTGGRTLTGPPPAQIIAPIGKAEFIESVRAHAVAWPSWLIDIHGRKADSYAVLTLCRTLYTAYHGEHVSKERAAAWAAAELPAWRPLIEAAVRIRVDQSGNEAIPRADVERFVAEISEHIAREDRLDTGQTIPAARSAP